MSYEIRYTFGTCNCCARAAELNEQLNAERDAAERLREQNAYLEQKVANLKEQNAHLFTNAEARASAAQERADKLARELEDERRKSRALSYAAEMLLTRKEVAAREVNIRSSGQTTAELVRKAPEVFSNLFPPGPPDREEMVQELYDEPKTT